MNDQYGSDQQIIISNWERYQYAKDRGHTDYVTTAQENEDMYLGGGLQWKDEDRAYLESIGRPVIENNYIFPAVNTAIGLQLASRVDIAFKPRRDGATEETATTLSKVVMQICDDIKFRWLESQMYEDGMIEQRGFIELRVNFDTNLQGDIEGHELDPLDVLPDPDAQSYDPASWQDVTVVKWLTIDEIAQLYGQDKADEVEETVAGLINSDLDDDYRTRPRFGAREDTIYRDDFTDETGIKRVLVIDRQSKRLERQKVLVSPSGDITPVGNMSPEKIAEKEAAGAFVTKRMSTRIRWTVTTADVLLHDDWSPYRTYTVIPYFPYFRRGRTRGMVDNAKSPQELNNKMYSQILHIINSSANGGWLVQEDSLTNMKTADLEDQGAKTGLVIEYAEKAEKPEKIQSNTLPTGFDRIVERTEGAIKNITGMSDAVQGSDGRSVSGVAKLSDQYMGQAQLSGPLDKLARTRHMVALKLLELVQDFYTEERIIMITDSQDIANIQHIPLPVNMFTPTGEILNDLTLGEYDVVITDQPAQATFQDNQFTQAMEMKKEGINIPDTSIVEMSSLTKKHDIAKSMTQQVEQADPEAEAKAAEKNASAALKDAQRTKEMALTEKVKAETVNENVDALYSATQTAGIIAATPAVAPLSDILVRSAGYVDKDAAPIIPAVNGLAGVEMQGMDMATGVPGNTNPTTPVPVPVPGSPAVGANAGIETQRID